MELTELKHKSLQFELSGVDEEQGPDAGPGQGLRTVGADAAQAEYGYDRGGQPRKALVSQKLGRPYKGFIHND